MKLTSGLLGIAALLMANQASAATVFIDPASVTVATKDVFTLTVKGTGFPDVADPLCEAPFCDPLDPATRGVSGGSVTLTCDSTVMEFTSVAMLDGFALQSPSLSPGVLNITGLQNPGSGAGADFSFAAITFTALAPPGTSLDIGLGNSGTWQLVDFSEVTLADSDYVGASITVNAVPVPPAVWLFGSGLLGLVGVARRRSPQLA
jgi:hypothetical protein